MTPGLPYWKIKNLLTESDLLHLIPEYGVLGLPARKPTVFTFHNFYIDPEYVRQAGHLRAIYYKSLMRASVQSSVKRASRITVVSRYLYNQVREHLPLGNTAIDLVYNGIDSEHFFPKPRSDANEEFRLLFVGNPSKRKGFAMLLALLDQLPAQAKIYYTTGLRKSEPTSMHPQLVPVPQTDYAHMPKLYQNCDALLFPTLREGFGLAVAEAMACGLPVISTNTSAIPELIDHNKGGILVQPDDTAGFLKAIQRLSRNHSLRAEMGAWNRERVIRDFQLSRMLNDYADVFSKC